MKEEAPRGPQESLSLMLEAIASNQTHNDLEKCKGKHFYYRIAFIKLPTSLVSGRKNTPDVRYVFFSLIHQKGKGKKLSATVRISIDCENFISGKT